MYPMNIGQAASAAGVTAKMIRHYESLGLIPAADRTDAGYRLYGEREVAMLRFIRQSRALGFSMKDVESLLALWRDPSRESREVKEVALRQLAELEQRQREIDQMKQALDALVAQCPGDQDAHCAILDTLANNAPPARALPACHEPRRTLKQVRAGERRPARTRKPAAPRAPVSAAHSSLVAWSRSFAAG